MANVIRYVNAGSTGGDGTTTALSGTNAAYASLSAALAAEATDLVSAGNTMYIRCFGSTADTTAISTSGSWTTDASNPLIIENATGESGGDPDLSAWDTNSYRLQPTASTGIDTIVPISSAGNDYMIIRNIQIGMIHSGDTGNRVIIQVEQSPWGGVLLIDKCSILCSGSGGPGVANGIANSFAGGTILVRNTLLVNTMTGTPGENRALSSNGSSSTIRAHNCTVRGWLTNGAFQSSSGTMACGNVLFEGNATDTAGTITNTQGNTTDNANFGTLSSTGNSVSQTYTFVASKSTLQASDTGAIGNGVDLSADGNLAVTEDAFGTARPQNTTWDAGYYEYFDPTPLITAIFADNYGAAQAGLSAIQWAWFDQDIGSLSAPTAQGSVEVTDLSGAFSVDVTGTALSSGQTGTLVLYDSSGGKYAAYRAIIGTDSGTLRFANPGIGGSFYFDAQTGVIGITSTPPMGPWR